MVPSAVVSLFVCLFWHVCVCLFREHMAPYTIPTGLVVVDEMPRNQMGKVNKKDLLKQFTPSQSWPCRQHHQPTTITTPPPRHKHDLPAPPLQPDGGGGAEKALRTAPHASTWHRVAWWRLTCFCARHHPLLLLLLLIVRGRLVGAKTFTPVVLNSGWKSIFGKYVCDFCVGLMILEFKCLHWN